MRRGKGGNMNNNLWSLITAFLKQRMRTKRWRRAVTCLAAVIVFGVTYALILPAITMTGKYPVLSAETLTAWTGDELTVKVSAETAPEDGGKTIVLTLEGEGADLSQNYAFNEEGICIILDEAQNEIELHRAVRDKVENTVDYWFAMEPGTQTVFTLNLADEVDAARFAETMEAVKVSGEEKAAEAEKATASDAGKSAAVVTEKKETGKATPADAEKKAEVKKASASNADVAEANKIAENSEEKIETESRDEGFVEILDGAVINDLEADEDEEEEQTEIVAELKVSAGVGDDYENAVKDAEKNADKRGDAQLKFQWKDVVAKQAEAPELVSYLNGATIAVFFDENAGIPAGAYLSVREIEEGTSEYAEYLAQAKSAMDKATGSDASKTVTQARFFDITILDEDGEEIEPQAAVKVVITYDKAVELSSDGDLNVVHFKNDDTQEVFAPVKPEEKQEVDALSFTTNSFSVFGVVSREVIVTTFTAGDGSTYEVVVNYGEDAGVPAGASLQVAELTEADPSYSTYVEKTAEKIESDVSELNYIRLLDISIVDKKGEKVILTAPVDVQIRLLDKPGVDDLAQVVHFAEDKTTKAEVPEVVDCAAKDDVVTFKADGFSVYAIVKAPGADDFAETGWVPIETVSELAQYGADGVYVRHPAGFYFKNVAGPVANPNSDESSRTGIKRTVRSNDVPTAVEGAALYFFEKVPATTNEFRVYCLDDDGVTKKYIGFDVLSKSLLFTDEDNAPVLVIGEHTHPGEEEHVFSVRCGDYQYWNLRRGVTGNGDEFCVYEAAGDTNAQMQFLRYKEAPEDPFDLEGKHYGLVYYNRDYNANTTATGYAMMGEAQDAAILSHKVVEGKMEYFDFFDDYFLAAGTDITMWEFEHVPPTTEGGAQNQYRIKTADGQYLGFGGTVAKPTLTLYTTPDPKTLITINAGEHDSSVAVDTAGMIQLRFTNYTGTNGLYIIKRWGATTAAQSGFTVTSSAGVATNLRTWFYLASETDLLDSAFSPYSATKISVSDPSLSAPYTETNPNPKVIVYTRVWDERNRRYQFFAIDKDGQLVRCYDGGGEIFWYDIDPEYMLWEFTEHLGADGKPSFYYDLESVPYKDYDKKFIRPQITGDQVFSSTMLGVNMEGRRYGDYYSKIIAWDQIKYAYAGLLANTANNTLEAVPMALSNDWYFAIVDDQQEENKLTLTETVDHEAYGITMRVFDYNATAGEGNDAWQTTVMGGYQQGGKGPVFNLVNKNLGADGYPVATTGGRSLHELFPDAPTGKSKVEVAKDVNHLFIRRTLEESGYFEFDSTQNYAVVGPDKGENSADFIVYDQLGSFFRPKGNSTTTQHGQFDPFNPLDKDGNLIADQGKLPFTNKYDIHGNSLNPLNPRYGEALYKNGTNSTMDFHFGVEMSATFMQTPNGKDDWGHDIIFEFSGDDDFWLFVDDVLVMDIGGVHYASDGRVNFATGQIYNQPPETGGQSSYTLRERFTAAYKEKNPDWTQTGLDEYLDGIFEPGTTIFKSYSSHHMRIFYMERGANASNIHMRFNLAPVKPGAIELEKHIEGTTQQSYASTKFAYQIFWKEKGENVDPDTLEPGNVTGYHQVGDEYSTHKKITVLYKATNQPVDHSSAHYLPDDPEHNEDGAICEDPWKVKVTGSETEYSYSHVYFLMPEQSAVIQFPGEDVEYYVKECFVNTAIYSPVEANEEELNGVAVTPDGIRKDFPIETDTVSERKMVSYVNHVNPNALRSLTVKKILHGKNGVLTAEDDPTTFRFRLYLGNELSPYSTDIYYVKDPEGHYCRREYGEWVPSQYTVFSDIPAADIGDYDYESGPWGTMDDIPSQYSIEIRDLLPDTRFKVEERPSDLPLGYDLGYYPHSGDPYSGEGAPRSFVDYERILDSAKNPTYDLDPDPTAPTLGYNQGRIIESSDASMNVHNRKGWGVSIEKTWSDQTFMESHDDIYFAVYYRGSDNELHLLDNLPQPEGEVTFYPVKRLTTEETNVVFFLDELLTGVNFKAADGLTPNYYVYEVQLKQPEGATVVPTVDANGNVTNYSSFVIDRIDDRIDEGGVLDAGGKQIGYSHENYRYKATYGPPAFNGTGNGVSYSVTNTRPGVKIVKEDWEGGPLLNAEFTLKDGQVPYGADSYISGDGGLLLMAYFGTGKPYTLKEVSAPNGYMPLPESINIYLNKVGETGDEHYTVTVQSAADQPTITIAEYDSSTETKPENVDVVIDKHATEEHIAVITVRDRKAGLELQKISNVEGKPLQGAVFQVFRDVSGQPSAQPVPGFTNLVTDENGMIPSGSFAGLPTNNRTFYLREKTPPEFHKPLEGDIKFNLNNGVVTLLDPVPAGVERIQPAADSQSRIYTLKVTDEINGYRVRFKKMNMDESQPLQSADFANSDMTGDAITLSSGEDGIMSYTENNDNVSVFILPVSATPYVLTETKAPNGYIKLPDEVKVEVKADDDPTKRIKAYSGEGESQVNYTVLVPQGEDDVYTVIIRNSNGVELPHTGGPGTLMYTLGGLLVLLASAVMYGFRRRHGERRSA